MNPVTAAVLKAGLISQAQLQEMRRFSPSLREADTSDPVPFEEAAKLVEDALQSEQYVLVRETDLEVVRQYASTTATGLLHMELDADQQGDVDVTFGRTPLGAYIIAWQSETIENMLTNGLTYLVADGKRIFFGSVRELFFGDNKAFIVCEPSSVEPDDHAG